MTAFYPPRALARRTLLKAGGAAALVPLLGRHASAGTLTWSPPTLVNALDVDVGSDIGLSDTIKLQANRDYIIHIGQDTGGVVVRRALVLEGGRNIVLIGGLIRRTPGTPATDVSDGTRTGFAAETFSISGHTGIAYVEGLVIDNNQQYGVDGIHTGTNGKYIFQNVHVRGVTGTLEGNHADGLQITGPTAQLYIDHMTVYSAYQGFNIQNQYPIGMCWIRNANTRYPNPDYSSGGANGYALWLGDGSYKNPASYKFENFYVQARTFETWADGSIWPARRLANGNRPYDGSDDEAAFPYQSVTGYVTEGIPPTGDFVPESLIVNGAGTVIYKQQT